jgi:DNA replication protein DnaC
MEIATTTVGFPLGRPSPAEERMLREDVVKEILARGARGEGVKHIARKLGVDRKTVKAWRRRGAWRAGPTGPRRRTLDAFAAFLEKRAPEVGWNGAVLHRELHGLGFRGGYLQVQRYLQPLRAARQWATVATVRFETGPGEQAQVDFGQLRLWIADTEMVAHLFVFTLGYSRRLWARARLPRLRRGRDPRSGDVRRAGRDGRGPMTAPQLDRLRTACQRLRLYQVETDLPTLLEQAAKREVSYTDFLDDVLAREVGAKTQKHLAMRVTIARFASRKTLDNFDFKFQPSIDVKLIRELATGRYVEGGDNVLRLGPPGVGKSHLAVALGLKACEQGYRALFTTVAGPITSLSKALADNRLDEKLRLLAQPQILVIDEIGYIPIDRHGATLFFQLIGRGYERGTIIVTSNQGLDAWGEVFGDSVIATAILDRLLHHSITIKGESYRLREKLKAGLLKPKLGADRGRDADASPEKP